MYCYHCGYLLNEKKVEKKQLSLTMVETVTDSTKVKYICPRCGHLIYDGGGEEQIKELSRASHAQVQRARNHFAFGMSFACIGFTLLALAVMFFVLAHKPANQFQLTTSCAEFYVSLVSGIISVILLVVGGIYIFKGLSTRIRYESLLRDINNKTFIQ